MLVFARVALCLIAVIPAFAQSPSETTVDEAAIRRIVDHYLHARERSDAKSVEALFTSDADQLVSSGEWRKGRSEIVRGTLMSSERQPGKRSITVESIRFLTADVALADGRYEITGLPGGNSRKMWTTLVLSRESGNWRIAAIRNMLPAAPAVR